MTFLLITVSFQAKIYVTVTCQSWFDYVTFLKFSLKCTCQTKCKKRSTFDHDVTIRDADWCTSDVFFDCDVRFNYGVIFSYTLTSENHKIYHLIWKLTSIMTSQWRQVPSVVIWFCHRFWILAEVHLSTKCKNHRGSWHQNKTCWLPHKWRFLWLWRRSTNDVCFNYGVIRSHNLMS
jgi:hypothetical protein